MKPTPNPEFESVVEVEQVMPKQDAQNAKAKTSTYPKNPEWLKACSKDKSGKVIPNLANVMIILRADERLSDLFAFDEMARDILLRMDIPGSQKSADIYPRPIRDSGYRGIARIPSAMD